MRRTPTARQAVPLNWMGQLLSTALMLAGFKTRVLEENDERTNESDRTCNRADATAAYQSSRHRLWWSGHGLKERLGASCGGDFSYRGIYSSGTRHQREPEARLRSADRRQAVQRDHKDRRRTGP